MFYDIFVVFYDMITSDQIRAARALLRWSAKDLADNSGVSWKTIQRMEACEGVPNSTASNLQAIMETLEAAGVVFLDANGGGPGVRLKS